MSHFEKQLEEFLRIAGDSISAPYRNMLLRLMTVSALYTWNRCQLLLKESKKTSRPAEFFNRGTADFYAEINDMKKKVMEFDP